MQSGVERDGEAPHHHEQVGHGQIEQDKVERHAQLLVLHGDVEREGVDWEGGADEKKHVRRQQRVLPWLGQVILRLLKRAAHQTSLVRHGHVEVRTFCSIHDWFTMEKADRRAKEREASPQKMRAPLLYAQIKRR